MSTATTPERHVWNIRNMGFTVLPAVIPADEVGGLRERLLEITTTAPEGATHQHHVASLSNMLNHEQSLAPYLADDLLLTIATELVGHHPHISFATVIINLNGNDRGNWHSDWPYNQTNGGHITAPYPDALVHLVAIWMMSPFAVENGGTLVLPGSHRIPTNPTAEGCPVDSTEVLPGEASIGGNAGDVLLFDARLWHATAQNHTDEPRVAVATRYAPWWLDVSALNPGTEKRRQLIEETGGKENLVPKLRRDVFDTLPAKTQDLLRHLVTSRE